MFICVINYITCAELWVDEVYEMIAVEVKGGDPKSTWETVGIYRASNKAMRVLDKLADRARYSGRTTKPGITGGELNLPYVGWNGHAEKI